MRRKIIDDEFIGRLESMTILLKTVMQGYHGGTHKASTYGSTVEFADFREYVPGDDIRRIDWNLYGRFEKHFIRLFIDERQMHTHIFLDCSASMGASDEKKSGCALKAAAALSFLSVQAMDRVSFKLVQGEKATDLCTTVVGRENLYGALHRLETVEFKGEADLEKAVIGCTAPGYDDGLTVIVSDFFTDSAWEKAVEYLLFRHREVLLVQVVTTAELNPAYSGRLHLIDEEAEGPEDTKNLRMNLSKADYRAYMQALEEHTAHMKQFCAARNVGYIRLNSDAPVERELFSKLFSAEIVK